MEIKNKDPAFLFYSSDFLTGTMLMSNEQVGMYIRLMCLQHQKGHLKEEDMLKICKTCDKDIFDKFVKDDEGLYYNERLENEVEKRKKYSESRRKNRLNKIDDDKSDEDMSNICQSYDEHMENENENINEDINNNKKEEKSKFLPPNLDEVKAYILEKGYSVNAVKFIAFYESNGWKVGKNKMKSWKSAITGWEAREKEQKTQPTKSPNKFHNFTQASSNFTPEQLKDLGKKKFEKDLRERGIDPNELQGFPEE